MMPPDDSPAPTREGLPGTTGDGQSESTGLPWFRTWRAVYIFTCACFVLYVVLLTLFSLAFS